MRIIVLVLILVCTTFTVSAEQRYNAFENRWETVPDRSNWKTRWNAFDNEWTYQPPNADLEYNAFENRWEWDSGHNPDSYEEDL